MTTAHTDTQSDSTTQPEAAAAEVQGLDWTTLPPVIAAALVKAQGLATTVDNDAFNSHGGYAYASICAIACKAREAMRESGLALMVPGWRLQDRMVRATCFFVHESGASTPAFSASMPVPNMKDERKTIAASLSLLRKYVMATMLNMSWSDPSEDADSDINHVDAPRGQGRHEGAGGHRQANGDGGGWEPPREAQRTTTKLPERDGPPDIPAHPNEIYETMLQIARACLQRAKDAKAFVCLATGLESIPKQRDPAVLRPHMLEAIALARKNMAMRAETGDLPADRSTWTHAQYLEFCVANELEFAMDHGQPNAIGEAADAKVEAWEAEHAETKQSPAAGVPEAVDPETE